MSEQDTDFIFCTIGEEQGFIGVLGIIALFFKVVIAKLYLILILGSMAFRVFGFKMSLKIPFLISCYKQLQKDRLTIMAHWYVDFKPVRDFIHISLISLILAPCIGIGIDMLSEVSTPVKELNRQLWLFSALVHMIVGFSTDVYIILCCNTPVDAKLAALCYRCTMYGCGGLLVNYEAVERNYIAPNPLYNVGGTITGRPSVVDRDQLVQYKLMRKWFTDIPVEAYTETNLAGRDFNTFKAHQVINQHPAIVKEMQGKVSLEEARALG